ncbi:neural cell adhesion molecule 2 [Glossina fuscipes]|uniref:Neural cell adhesion molecule 2 n=1 Tax=Glossina fuscipes TaxID=7396 RepID=A0A8U0WH63_9MUSC|nr:neural cell adhesion molecule 2 [Glossina fuscipes]
MKLIGLLLNLATTAFVAGSSSHHENGNETDGLRLIPSDHTVVRYTNESLIVLCRNTLADTKVHWKSPKGDIIKEHKGRIHIEASPTSDDVKLVFMHISLADKGDWSCEHAGGGDKASKPFNLIVYQKITFTENTTILTVKEGTNATILCEVKGEPQPNVTWHYNGQPITLETNSTKFRILADGLLINSVTQNDTGEYTCRAYQVNPIASDMQERTVLLKIEHKPIWTYMNVVKERYTFINGTTTLKCEAIAEPPANFSWYRSKKQIHNDKHYRIESGNYVSTLHIRVDNEDVFNVYKCKVKNHLGSIERALILKRGEKPPTPKDMQLRGYNSNTFDIVVNHPRSSDVADPLMKVTGYRIEYMTELEFKKDLGKWTNAKRKEFAYEEGATFLISNLEANTSYLVRAASRNLAGYSDWTKVEKFHTLSLTPANANSATSLTSFYTAKHWLLGFAVMSLHFSKNLAFGCRAQQKQQLLLQLVTGSCTSLSL